MALSRAAAVMSLNYTEYRLVFRSPLRLGDSHRESAVRAPRLHSDLLYRAIASASRELFGRAADAALPGGFESPAIRLSSAFPFVVGMGPLAPATFADNHLVRVDAPEDGPVNLHPLPWAVSMRARASFNRRSARRTERYSVAEVRFAPGAGLWFGARFDKPELRGEFEAALRYLGDCGIAGGRSTGAGVFEIAATREVTVEADVSLVRAWWVLSRFRPTESEFANGQILGGAAAVAWSSWPVPNQDSELRFIAEGATITAHAGLNASHAGQSIAVSVARPDAATELPRAGFLFALPAPVAVGVASAP